MNTQNQVELALAHWSNGNKTEFQNIIKNEVDNIFNYKGLGDIFTYFIPALLIEDFWKSLQEIDFPLEKIVYKNIDIISWATWDHAIDYMFSKDPDMLNDYAHQGLYEEHFDPALFEKNNRNYEIILNYFNADMQNQINILVDSYLSMSDEEWEKIQENLTKKVNELNSSKSKFSL